MPSYDYEVDLQSLAAAASGLNDSVQLMRDHDVEDLVPGEADLGSAVVWAAVEEFRNRWEEGLNNLVHDVEEMAGRLGRIAMNYHEADQRGYESLHAVAGRLADLRVMGP
ncbi:WXG100 family type VII secretion target [Nocardioides sp. GCM10027113]|uniref:WXG100 family type VII secretion target n=1 Tax=unclassified Nocardioides TaxID=2615069 RepID=UPI0036159A93